MSESKAEAKDARAEPKKVKEIKGEGYKPETEHLRCRFYENPYPELEEVVVCNVEEIGDMGAKVTLLEYDHIEGMILLSELSRRRIRSINKLVRVNRTEYVRVIRVDREKGYIDLSKRQVDPEDTIKCKDRYNKAKNVHSVLRFVAEQRGLRLETLYQSIGWPLYAKYGHAYDAFKLAVSEEAEDIFQGLDVQSDLKAEIMTSVARKLSSQPVKIRADMDVKCFTYEGIEAIKEALQQGEAKGTTENPVRIKLIAPPTFVMTCTTLDKDFGIDLLTQAIDAVRVAIVAKGGSVDVKMDPKVVSQRDDLELQATMERLALDQSDPLEDEDEGPALG